jgi:uncharacterized membrane protein YhaH (DUF805 family)
MKSITVGRSELCDIIINESNISRIHAEISLSEGKYTFRDVSTNGSSVNGRSLINSEVTINSNSSILLAHSIPLYWSKIEALLPTSSNNPISVNKTEVLPTENTPIYNQKQQGMFSNPFSFDGRIRRLEYGLSYIIFLVLYVIIIGVVESNSNLSIIGLALIPLLWFYFAQATKRCHDRGNSGWYQIIPFYFFWMVFEEGDAEENEYGISPKQ